MMVEERLGMSRIWDTSLSARSQVHEQRVADEHFDRTCELAKMLGIRVAKPHRFMQPPDEDAEFRFTFYFIRTSIRGTREAMEYFRAMLDNTLPPPIEARSDPSSYYEQVMREERGIPLLVSCCFCPVAFTTKALLYQNTPHYTVERDTYCPCCHARIVHGKELAVIPTSEEQAEHFEKLAQEQTP